MKDKSFKNSKKTLEINTISHFKTISLVLNKMINRNHGHIVTISSSAAYIPVSGCTDYNASKYAVLGMHEALSIELRQIKTDVKATVICPSFIKTNMT